MYQTDLKTSPKQVGLKQRVYDYLLTVPKGRAVTYGQIAAALGNRHLCRVVGNILHVNPDPKRYPCFRVVDSRGCLSRNFGDGGIEVQKQRLIADGIEVEGYRIDLDRYGWKNPQ